MNSSLRPPIFIGGTGRSGTTILTRLLQNHPDIHTIKWESQFIVANNGLLELINANEKDRLTKFDKFKFLMDTHWFERVVNKGLDNEYKAGLVADVSRAKIEELYELLSEAIKQKQDMKEPKFIRGCVNKVFSQSAIINQANRWCEKTPSNILYAKELKRIYPNMKFVNIIRDGRDVVSSVMKRKFWPVAANNNFEFTSDFRGKHTVRKVAEYWKTLTTYSDLIAQDIGSSNFIEIRLEDLVKKKKEVLENLFDFLGHDLNDNVLNFDLTRSNIGRYKDDMTSDEISTMTQIMYEALGSKGYL
ncbi:MAG TPA: hypothetical protein DG048_24260 [Pseudoalteromonas sp.]|nr:hypothetical protein [Pseudoalteromonas sp.]|tara:strand:+ start:2996 stop:3904 length:909 start_codon:yes stop_codon:yes gene_type:complete